LLYLSLYFKTHRDVYYDLLQRVRLEGDWEAWIQFFLEGVVATAEQATNTAHRVLALLRDDRELVSQHERATPSARRLLDHMTRRPLLTIRRAANDLGTSHQTISAAMRHLQDLGIVAESTGRKRDRVFVYSRYVSILNEGTTPA